VVDVRDVLEGRVAPDGDVVVVDDLGFHQATSVAELLADRGASVEVMTPAMVVGQDLGITLDMEGWLMRAHAKKIVQSTDLVVMGAGAREDGDGLTLDLLHHPTGAQRTRSCDWVVVATHQQPVDELWRRLRDDPALEVHRIGDAVAPRRAHSAVIEGHRVAVTL
jgi:2,4-dienoyl-CoA reductase (NADPH2)